MQFFKKKCALCGKRINKKDEFIARVKVPEFKGLQKTPFCSEKHADCYKNEITGTKRTHFCPTCPIGN